MFYNITFQGSLNQGLFGKGINRSRRLPLHKVSIDVLRLSQHNISHFTATGCKVTCPMILPPITHLLRIELRASRLRVLRFKTYSRRALLQVLKTLIEKSCENIEGKEENVGNKHFPLFPRWFFLV